MKTSCYGCLYYLSIYNRSFSLFVKLFDFQVQPIVLCGADKWGRDAAAVLCEKIHLYADEMPWRANANSQ